MGIDLCGIVLILIDIIKISCTAMISVFTLDIIIGIMGISTLFDILVIDRICRSLFEISDILPYFNVDRAIAIILYVTGVRMFTSVMICFYVSDLIGPTDTEVGVAITIVLCLEIVASVAVIIYPCILRRQYV